MSISKYPLIVLFISLAIIHSSCKKPLEPKTADELLTGSLWQIEEIRYLKLNVEQHYKRGASDNTVNYDNEYIKFESNKTGTLYGSLAPAPVTWSFANPEKTKLQFTVQFQGVAPILVTWENILFSEQSIRYTEYYIQDGAMALGEGIRTPR